MSDLNFNQKKPPKTQYVLMNNGIDLGSVKPETLEGHKEN